jgi:hypothetical protein
MAFESQGTQFFWGDTTALSTSSTNLVGEVKTFNGPSGSANVIDITSLGSTAKEKLMGIRDEGQLTLEVNLMPSDAAQMKLRTDRAARTLKAWILKLNDNATDGNKTRLKGDGYCTGFAISGGVDDVVKASITIEITGAVVWSTAAP